MKELCRPIYDFISNKFYFKLLYLFVSMSFVTILTNMPGKKILSSLALVWGLLLVILTIVRAFKERKMYNFDISLMLFLSITFVFNILFYFSVENMKIWAVNLILIICIFSIDVFKNKKGLLKELNVISYSYTIFMFILAVGSLILNILGKTIEIGDNVFGIKQGLFVNPNALSIACGIAILISLYLHASTEKIKVKIMLVCNIVIQAVTMLTGEGRSALLLVMCLFYMLIFTGTKKKIIRVTLILLPILIALGLAFSESEDVIRVFTSGRNSLWTSASLVVKEHPITGVGNSNFVEAVKAARETTDLPGLEAGGTHNIYVQIATINGLPALACILVFLGLIFKFILEKLDHLKRKEKFKFTILTSLVLGILVVNIFESNLVYIISFISMIFWIYLGYIISILDNRNIN